MPVIPEIFRKFDVKRFSRNPVLSDLHCQKAPTVAVRIFGQSLFFRYLVENQETPRSAKRIRTQAINKIKKTIYLLVLFVGICALE